MAEETQEILGSETAKTRTFYSRCTSYFVINKLLGESN